jgi:hypothetical protein
MSMPAGLSAILTVVVIAGLSMPPRAVKAKGADGGPAPWLGTWQLNPAKSSQRSDPSPYRRVTFRIEPAGDIKLAGDKPAGDAVKVTYRMVGTRGGVTRLEWTGGFDGRDYPVRGADNVLTNAYRRIDGRAYEIVIKVEGERAAVATVTVSPDGRTLTVVTAERHPRGQTVNTTAVYEKQ